MESKVFVVIPMYNENIQVVKKVLEGIVNEGFKNIILVDDGSSDKIDVSELSFTSFEPILLRHDINIGKGAAVRNGFKKAISLRASVIITFDADGQHDSSYIDPMAEKVRYGIDVVLGCRTFDKEHMPIYNVLANKMANFFTWLFCGLYVEDSQCGFRAYSTKAFPMVLETKSNQYEYESEIIRGIYTQKLTYTEIPIRAIYTTYSKNKKTKQSFFKGLKTLFFITQFSLKRERNENKDNI